MVYVEPDGTIREAKKKEYKLFGKAFTKVYTIRNFEKSLLDDMVNLYNEFCMLELIMDNKGNYINFKYRWTNKEAEILFKECEKLFLLLKEKQLNKNNKILPNAFILIIVSASGI